MARLQPSPAVPVVATLLLSPALLPAQSVPVVRLEGPEASLSEPFTAIRGVRELSDGRILVSDAIEARVVLVDPGAADVTEVGRRGGGPGEYERPHTLYAGAADTTYLLDLRGRRLLTLGPDGTPTGAERRLEMVSGGFRPPRGMDAAGRFYLDLAGIFAPGLEGALRGRIGLLRVDPASARVDTVAELSVPPMAPPSGAGMSPVPPYRPTDDWAVDPDGRVAVVRHDPYRVEWFGPDGDVRSGPPVDYDPVPVGRAEREAYLDLIAGGPGAVVTQGGERRTVRPPRIAADQLEWPDVLPPFEGPPWIADDGRLWVRRTLPAADLRALYDVFDGEGRLVRQIELPEGRTIVGMGAGTIYAVRTDDVGLQWLERYRP